jgi:hypothetical protein
MLAQQFLNINKHFSGIPRREEMYEMPTQHRRPNSLLTMDDFPSGL